MFEPILRNNYHDRMRKLAELKGQLSNNILSNMILNNVYIILCKYKNVLTHLQLNSMKFLLLIAREGSHVAYDSFLFFTL